MRKFLYLLIVVLMTIVHLSPVINQDNVKAETQSTENILYVGGDGAGNYTNIQDALYVAKNKDTVYVYSGIYYENIKIRKSINLIGEDKENTIIDARGIGDCIFVNACDVCISGFTIKNTTTGQGIYVQSLLHDAERIRILGNIIKECYYGIELYHSRNNKILGNKIHDNFIGINLDATDSSIIAKNNISNNNISIMLYFSMGNSIKKHRNEIYENNIRNSHFGIFVSKCWFRLDEIHSNNFINNTFSAYFLNCMSKWHDNFWDDKRDFLTVYLIAGNYSLCKVPKLWFWWVQMDCNPACEPYEIDIDSWKDKEG